MQLCFGGEQQGCTILAPAGREKSRVIVGWNTDPQQHWHCRKRPDPNCPRQPPRQRRLSRRQALLEPLRLQQARHPVSTEQHGVKQDINMRKAAGWTGQRPAATGVGEARRCEATAGWSSC